MKAPRILPLVAIAAAGVLAINAVENGPGIYGAARAFAEGVVSKTGADPASSDAPPLPADTNAAAPADSDQAAAAKPAPICAESPEQLAKDAGLSPAELQVIQSLGARRGELDQREAGLDTQLALIQAAEAKVDARIDTMNALKADMQGMIGQLGDKQAAEVARLVKVYSNMDPQNAADRFVLLTDEVRLPIAEQMSERKLSPIIEHMSPAEAKRLTESLAARYVAQAQQIQNAIAPPPAQAAAAPPAAAPPAKAPAPPAQAATPAPTAAPSSNLAQAQTLPPAKPRPLMHRKPKPKPALAAAKAADAGALAAGAAADGASASAAPASPKPTAAAAPPKPAASAGAAPPPPAPAASAAAPAKTG